MTPRKEPSCTENHDAQRRYLRDEKLSPTPCRTCGWLLSAMRGSEPEDEELTLEERIAVIQEQLDRLTQAVEIHGQHLADVITVLEHRKR